MATKAWCLHPLMPLPTDFDRSPGLMDTEMILRLLNAIVSKLCSSYPFVRNMVVQSAIAADCSAPHPVFCWNLHR